MATATNKMHPPLVLDPQKRVPLVKTQTHHAQPEPMLPIKRCRSHPRRSTLEGQGQEGGSIFFIGTATTLISWAGIRILTDPNFLHAGDHVHLGPAVTSTRLTNPAVPDLASLPPIDCILLSHYHEDHFDKKVESDLSRDVPIITTPHAKACLTTVEDGGKKDSEGFNRVWGLEFWDGVVMPVERGETGETGEGGGEGKKTGVRVTAMPGKHVPNGVLGKANELLGMVPPTNGWLVELGWTEDEKEFETGYRIYISGDTLLVDELKEIPERLEGDKIDLMLVHLGGTTIPGPKMPLLMVTMDAKQGVQLMRLVDPDVTVPIHFDDYDVFLSPLEDFKKEVQAAGFGERVVYLDRGEEYKFAVKAG